MNLKTAPAGGIMNKRIKNALSQMNSPRLLPRKKRFLWAMLCGIPFAFLLLYFYYEASLLLSILCALAFGIFFAVAFALERRAEKNDAAFRQAVESGAYYAQEKWREAYRSYSAAHDFQRVTAQTMKADLCRRYHKRSGDVMIAVSLVFFVPAILWNSGAVEANVFLAIGGLIFLSWGLAKLLRTPVRPFLRACGENLPQIERSYLNGKMLTFRRNGHFSENNGINIGGNYIVLYDKNGIRAVDSQQITDVIRNIRRIKYYNNSIYGGTRTEYCLMLKYTGADGQPHSTKVQLNEFQVEMAYDAISGFRNAVQVESQIHHEVGI